MSTPTFRSEVLRQLRHDRGITLEQLGERVGVPHPRVSEWEQGRRVPRPGHLVRLAAVLGVEPLELTAADPAHLTLADLRIRAGLSLAAAQEQSGIQATVLSRLERGERVRALTEHRVDELARLYGASPDEVRACAAESVSQSLPARPPSTSRAASGR